MSGKAFDHPADQRPCAGGKAAGRPGGFFFPAAQPSDEAIPLELVKEYTARVIDKYGVRGGFSTADIRAIRPCFPRSADFLNKDGDRLLPKMTIFVITYGSSEAIFAVGSAFIRPGETG